MKLLEEKSYGPVRFIPGLNNGRYPYCHSAYVEGAGILIDPASDRERLARLREEDGVTEIWLTHWHEDHIAHLDLFEDVPIVISQRDVAPLTDMEVFLDWYGLSEEHKVYWREALKNQFNYRPRKPARVFGGGETIDLGGLTVDVIETPGHTPGHLSFFFREPAVMVLGDYDLSKFGPWYGDRDSSIPKTVASARKLSGYPARVWIPGHEDNLIEGDAWEAFEAYLAVIESREQKLLAFLSEPRAMDEIVGQWIIYRKPREPKGFFEFGERALMGKHLEKLMEDGRVIENKNGFVAV